MILRNLGSLVICDFFVLFVMSMIWIDLLELAWSTDSFTKTYQIRKLPNLMSVQTLALLNHAPHPPPLTSYESTQPSNRKAWYHGASRACC